MAFGLKRPWHSNSGVVDTNPTSLEETFYFPTTIAKEVEAFELEIPKDQRDNQVFNHENLALAGEYRPSQTSADPLKKPGVTKTVMRPQSIPASHGQKRAQKGRKMSTTTCNKTTSSDNKPRADSSQMETSVVPMFSLEPSHTATPSLCGTQTWLPFSTTTPRPFDLRLGDPNCSSERERPNQERIYDGSLSRIADSHQSDTLTFLEGQLEELKSLLRTCTASVDNLASALDEQMARDSKPSEVIQKRKRKRTRGACQRCHLLKIKCFEERPCPRCKANKVDCLPQSDRRVRNDTYPIRNFSGLMGQSQSAHPESRSKDNRMAILPTPDGVSTGFQMWSIGEAMDEDNLYPGHFEF